MAFKFATCPEGLDVFFYNADWTLRTTTPRIAPNTPDFEQCFALCATRAGTVWAAYDNLNPTQHSILRELNVDTGAVIRTIALAITVCDQAQPETNALHELSDGSLLTQNRVTKEVVRIAVPSGAITVLGTIPTTEGVFDVGINAAGTQLIYNDSNDQTERVWDVAAWLPACLLINPDAYLTIAMSVVQAGTLITYTAVAGGEIGGVGIYDATAVFTWSFQFSPTTDGIDFTTCTNIVEPLPLHEVGTAAGRIVAFNWAGVLPNGVPAGYVPVPHSFPWPSVTAPVVCKALLTVTQAGVYSSQTNTLGGPMVIHQVETYYQP